MFVKRFLFSFLKYFDKETSFILSFEMLLNGLIDMRRRMSSKDFLKFFDCIWEAGPTVRYQNPDKWSI